jgi:hypothetical protein
MHWVRVHRLAAFGILSIIALVGFAYYWRIGRFGLDSRLAGTYEYRESSNTWVVQLDADGSGYWTKLTNNQFRFRQPITWKSTGDLVLTMLLTDEGLNENQLRVVGPQRSLQTESGELFARR